MREILRVDANFAKQIKEECGVNVFACYQCKRCTSGCPVSDEMDYPPHQIIRALQFGHKDLVLNSKTIWLCASCETCTTRCPQRIGVGRLMDTLRSMVLREEITPKLSTVPLFNRIALKSIEKYGRIYELGTTLAFNVRTGRVLKDVPLGIKLLLKRRLKLLPSWAHYPEKIDAIPTKATVKEPNKVAYFSGCSLHSIGSELNLSSQAVCRKLGLKIEEPENWVCCGTTPAHSTSHLLATVLPIKNLALVEKMGHSYMTVPCAGCFFRFKAATYDIERDSSLREEVAKEIGYNYADSVKIEHLIDTLVNKVGRKTIADKVVRELKGLKVVCYYGCFLTRPPEVTGAKHPEYPRNMDELMSALGIDCL
ncbi:MAG: heterodisulfide reductase-related iron-sulfur binding cluster, partial [Candidatus Subteraquimicrobiales bacterium]|nr:heterodisulfide reductase-related iron-sulfur binding cluster [Candidatus Subteraquimicrobiales bacterium]